MIARIRNLIFQQYLPFGMWLGAFQSQVYSAQSNIGVIQFLLIVVMAYQSTIRAFLFPIFPWINFGWFLIIGTILFLLLMIVDYKIMMPSRMAYGNFQTYKHPNPVFEEIKTIKKNQDKILEQLKELQEEIKRR